MRFSSYFILFTIILISSCKIYAEDTDVLIDPMIPKLPGVVASAVLQEKKNNIPILPPESFNLSAIGYSEGKIYCIINGNVLSLNDNIEDYVISKITITEVILIKKTGEQKKIILD